MDENNLNQPPQVEGAPQGIDERSAGPVIGIIIIVLVVVLGGLYFWGSRLNAPEGNLTPEQIRSAEDAELEALQTQSTSDAVSDIEEDLEGTELKDIDQELDDIDNELENF